MMDMMRPLRFRGRSKPARRRERDANTSPAMLNWMPAKNVTREQMPQTKATMENAFAVPGTGRCGSGVAGMTSCCGS